MPEDAFTPYPGGYKTNEEYLEKLKIVPSDCDCEICKRMCKAPCYGSVADMEKLIKEGFADQLMLEDIFDSIGLIEVLKPALKGFGGKNSRWNVVSEEGCIFWNQDRKCDLHEKGLKPIHGKIAHHNQGLDYYDEFANILREDWGSERGNKLIEEWKKLVNYDEDRENLPRFW